MRYTTLGRSGLQVSRLCLGMMSYGNPAWQAWVLGYDEAKHFVKRSLDAGINFFDTADFYSLGASEEMLGAAIGELASRHSVAITTKVGLPMGGGVNNGGLSRKHIMESVDASLKRLKTDYIDLYFMHQPDPRTPVEETVNAMADLVQAGKVLYFGLSNMPLWLASKILYCAKYERRLPLGCIQLQYNLCFREEERETLPLCADEGVGVMAYSPLARGWLAGNRHQGAAAPVSATEALRASSDAKGHSLYGSTADEAILDALIEVARERDVPPARIAMAWVLSNPLISSMICGVLEDRHLDEALLAAELDLTADERARLERSYVPQLPKDTGLGAVLSSQKPQNENGASANG